MIPQGTPEWMEARLGRVTASRVADVVAKTKSGYSASRANYMGQLIAERLTGEPQDSYTNAAMAWGIEHEDAARIAYEFRTDAEVGLAGFVKHPTIPMSGASPDGFVGAEGLVEIKCPNTSTHIDTLLGGKVPAKYITQIHFQMACTGRLWCDFVSFDPRLPESMRLWVHRIERDNELMADLEQEVRGFLKELDGKVAELRAQYERDAA